MERKAAASRKKYDVMAQALANEKRRHETAQGRDNEKRTLLDGQYTALQHDMEVLTLKMEEEKALQTDAFNIRHSEQRRVLVLIISLTLALILTVLFRGKPLKDYFVRHCRCLLATGSSARSVREQLFLNGAFFLGEEQYTAFRDAMPQLDWFNTQREGMGYESILYSFVAIAKCDSVLQWGFDETGLNGVPTLNQWCRIQEGDTSRTVTIECAGLLTGSTATRVAQHVKLLWQRGQEAVNMLRQEMGDEADLLVPLVNGGVTMAKLRGVMHDTCNSANLIAKKVRIIRDEAGEELYGKEEWLNMQELGRGWQDFL